MIWIKGIRAKLYVLGTDEGGRKSGLFSGYRPSIWWEGLEDRGGNDGELILEDKDKCSPGEECIVRMEFFHPEFVPCSIKIGARFTAREGGRIIGRGTVLEIFSKD